MDSSIPQNSGIAALIHASNNRVPSTEVTTSIFGEDGFTFGDIIDIVNPLQHIPIVSNIYRKMTGDTIAPAMEIAGGALFGGPLGAVAALVTTAYQSYMQDHSKSTDPDSPYVDESTAIASNADHPSPKSISSNDYSLVANSGINKAGLNNDNDVPGINKAGSWILNSEYFNNEKTTIKTDNSHASINTLKSKHVYQPADGIVNLAYKKTETYTDVITSTNTPEKTIDIIIGATAGAG